MYELDNGLNKKRSLFIVIFALTGLAMFEKEYELPEENEYNVCSSKLDSKVCFEL